MEQNSHATSRLADCRILELERHDHANGTIAVVQNDNRTPFPVRRVFYLYDVPSDAERGGHSHHLAQELIVAISGSFDVRLSDGVEERTFSLNRPYRALYIPAGIWRELNNFSSGSVCLVLTSEKFDEADYVRSHSVFQRLTSSKSNQ